jgi:hypothetical protein
MPFDPVHQQFRLEALEKIDRVIALLNEQEAWCKGKLRTEDGRLCILGAVREADAELFLYGPILRAIREVTGHAYHQIERFNDSWLTTHTLVMDVLERTRQDLGVGVVIGIPVRQPPPRAKARPTPTLGIRRFFARIRAF